MVISEVVCQCAMIHHLFDVAKITSNSPTTETDTSVDPGARFSSTKYQQLEYYLVYSRKAS